MSSSGSPAEWLGALVKGKAQQLEALAILLFPILARALIGVKQRHEFRADLLQDARVEDLGQVGIKRDLVFFLADGYINAAFFVKYDLDVRQVLYQDIFNFDIRIASRQVVVFLDWHLCSLQVFAAVCRLSLNHATSGTFLGPQNVINSLFNNRVNP